MASKRKAAAPAGGVMPEFRRIPMDRILEPEMPARAEMDTAKMQELVESMRAIGQIEPVTVEEHDAMYELMTGHRRFLAAQTLQWTELSALVYREGCANKLALMLHENVVREDLNPAEEALFMAQAREQMKLDEAGLCALFKRSAEYIGQRFALLRGDEEIFAALQRREIRLGVAQELNRITDEGMRRYYLDCARRGDPPARVVHQWVQTWIGQESARQLMLSAGVNPPAGPPAGDGGASPAGDGDGAAAGVSSAAPAASFGCELCGGDRDPYNLVTIRIHRWEWERILEQVAKAARGEL